MRFGRLAASARRLPTSRADEKANHDNEGLPAVWRANLRAVSPFLATCLVAATGLPAGRCSPMAAGVLAPMPARMPARHAGRRAPRLSSRVRLEHFSTPILDVAGGGGIPQGERSPAPSPDERPSRRFSGHRWALRHRHPADVFESPFYSLNELRSEARGRIGSQVCQRLAGRHIAANLFVAEFEQLDFRLVDLRVAAG